MEEFIAIRRSSRVERGIVGASLSISEKNKAIQADVAHSERGARLEHELNLTPLSAATTDIQPDVVGPPVNNRVYSRMKYVGAFYVKTDDKQQAAEAKAVFGDEYLIVPNIPLSLPPTVRTEIRGERSRNSLGWPAASGIDAAHSQGIKGEGVRVFVMDTGCDADHAQFLRKRINYRYIDPLNPLNPRDVCAFDTAGHGTHVCGIIAGRTTGVAPDVELCVASVIESETMESALNRILHGLNWMLSEVIHTAKPTLLNLSLGFPPSKRFPQTTTLAMEAIRAALQTAIDDFNVLSIVATGNEADNTYRYPGVFPEVLAVGAVDFNNQIAEFTSRGTFDFEGTPRLLPDIWGYGHKVYSALERNNEKKSIYAEKSGTSMATPYVTGIAALYAQETGLQGIDLREHLLNNALLTDFGKIAAFQPR